MNCCNMMPFIIIFTSVVIIALAIFNIYYENSTCFSDRFRIKKVTFSTGQVFYYIQKKTRFMFIGPYIWEYFQDIYDGNYSSHIAWTYFRCMGDRFLSLESAEKTKNDITVHILGDVVNEEIVQ